MYFYGLKMLFKDFGNYVVFGWYYLKEYNRSSNNSFEAILYDNNSFEYRYRELDIKNHDVLIGEQGKGFEGMKGFSGKGYGSRGQVQVSGPVSFGYLPTNTGRDH